MKKIIFTLMVAFLGLTAQAQVYVGGSFSLLHNSNTDMTTFLVAPEIGYNFNKNWALGGELGFAHFNVNNDFSQDDSYNCFYIAPYARYSFFEAKIVRLFVDGGMGFSTSNADTDNNGFEIGFKPGIAIELGKHFCFVTKYGFLGYRNHYQTNNSTSGLSLSSEDLSIGFHYEF